MTGAFHVDAWIVAGALKNTVDLIRDNLGDQAADAVANNLGAQLEKVAEGFDWRGVMAGNLALRPTPAASEELRWGEPSAWEKHQECEPPDTGFQS